MAKTRAQRKAERRRREAQVARQGDGDSKAQHRTQVPESADVVEAELAEKGADLVELASETTAEADAARAEETVEAEAPEAPAPSRADVGRPTEVDEEPTDKISRRARKQEERERKRRAKESAERRQKAQAAPP